MHRCFATYVYSWTLSVVLTMTEHPEKSDVVPKKTVTTLSAWDISQFSVLLVVKLGTTQSGHAILHTPELPGTARGLSNFTT